MAGDEIVRIGWRWTSIVIISIAFFAAPQARGEMTVEKLTGSAVTGIGPYVQDVTDAIRQFGAKNYPKALEHLENAKKTTPRLAPPEVMMAQLYYDAGQPSAGAAMLEKAVRRVPQDPEAYVILAERALAEGRVTEADLLFERVAKTVESFTENPRRRQDLQGRIYNGAATVDESRGDLKGAKVKLEALIKADPRSAAAHERLARVLFGLGEQEAAYKEFQLAAEDKKMLPAELAMAYQSPDKTRAEKWLNFALKKSAQDVRTQLGAAGYLLRNNQPDAATAHAEEALKMAPNDFDANSTAGLIARMTGDYKKAETCLAKAHLLAPTHPGVINHLALVLLEMPEEEHRQQALLYAELGAKLNPNQTEAMTTLGWISYRLNRRREAERAFTAAMTLPDGSANPIMTSDMAYYLAHLAKEQGNVPEAVKMLQEALNTDAPFAYRKSAEEFLAQLTKGDKSQQKTKSEKSPSAAKSADPANKAGAAK